MLYFLALVATITAIIVFLHWYSYHSLKSAIVSRRTWDLNICCGTTDGGGVNVDIVQHTELPNFIKVDNIYSLPFDDQQFETVLCSHTIEHVDYPRRFDRELRRVAKEVVYILPPAWDLAAALNIWEHKWLFLTMRKVHHTLPRCTPLPFARKLQARVGQRVTA
jgi:predicted SAM-dependent methyltransferase